MAVTVGAEADPDDVVTVTWCGVEYPVRNERLQAAVTEAQKLEAQFVNQKELDVYDKVVAAYSFLIGLVKQALSAGVDLIFLWLAHTLLTYILVAPSILLIHSKLNTSFLLIV